MFTNIIYIADRRRSRRRCMGLLAKNKTIRLQHNLIGEDMNTIFNTRNKGNLYGKYAFGKNLRQLHRSSLQ